MWAYWHSLSVGSGKPVSWRMKIRLTSGCITDTIFPVWGKTASQYKKMERSSFCPTYIRLKVPDFTDGQRKTIPQKMYKSPHEVVTGANIKKSFERTNGWAVFFLTLQKYGKFIKRNWFILVHFQKNAKNGVFLESPSARNPRLSQMRNDKLA